MKHKKLCYIVRDYFSFRSTAQNYQYCINSLNYNVVERPEDADIVILHGLISDISDWYSDHPTLKEKYVIGYCVWETDTLPMMHHHNLKLLDEVWTASEYSRRALIEANPNTFVIPHVAEAVQTNERAINALKDRIGYNEKAFYFYTICRSSDPRKNLIASIRALSNLTASGKVHFLIKDHSISRHLENLPTALPPGMQLIRDDFDPDLVGALHAVGHCFVSSHFSEAWGLGLSEAMCAGNIVVATGHSGNMDFMTAENAFPIRFDLVPIDPEITKFSQGTWTKEMKWGKICEADYRSKLRHVLTNWNELEPLRHRAQSDLARFSRARIANLIGKRLDSLEQISGQSVYPQ